MPGLRGSFPAGQRDSGTALRGEGCGEVRIEGGTEQEAPGDLRSHCRRRHCLTVRLTHVPPRFQRAVPPRPDPPVREGLDTVTMTGVPGGQARAWAGAPRGRTGDLEGAEPPSPMPTPCRPHGSPLTLRFLSVQFTAGALHRRHRLGPHEDAEGRPATTDHSPAPEPLPQAPAPRESRTVLCPVHTGGRAQPALPTCPCTALGLLSPAPPSGGRQVTGSALALSQRAVCDRPFLLFLPTPTPASMLVSPLKCGGSGVGGRGRKGEEGWV